jgi:NAD(P)H-dependent flavin oxidoreductase YrpB (nitropropane dioxygenase family)
MKMLQELLGIELPIIQAPMAGVQSSALAVAVCNAGGLFPCAMLNPVMNRVMRELGPICDLAPEFPLASAAMAPLRAKAEATGSGDFSPLWAGQNSSGCREIPAAELTQNLAQGIS